jgi:hypothetical protein
VDAIPERHREKRRHRVPYLNEEVGCRRADRCAGSESILLCLASETGAQYA